MRCLSVQSDSATWLGGCSTDPRRRPRSLACMPRHVAESWQACVSPPVQALWRHKQASWHWTLLIRRHIKNVKDTGTGAKCTFTGHILPLLQPCSESYGANNYDRLLNLYDERGNITLVSLPDNLFYCSLFPYWTCSQGYTGWDRISHQATATPGQKPFASLDKHAVHLPMQWLRGSSLHPNNDGFLDSTNKKWLFSCFSSKRKAFYFLRHQNKAVYLYTNQNNSTSLVSKQ